MTSVCGHVLGVDFTSKYNNWDRVDPVELFSCPIEKKEAAPNLKMPAFLAQEAIGCDTLVLWLDCDKEGENICFEVMASVSKAIAGNVYSDAVTYRARFSAITEKDIKAAFNNLSEFHHSSIYTPSLWVIVRDKMYLLLIDKLFEHVLTYNCLILITLSSTYFLIVQSTFNYIYYSFNIYLVP